MRPTPGKVTGTRTIRAVPRAAMVWRSTAYSVDANGSVIDVTLSTRLSGWADVYQYAEGNFCPLGSVKGPCALQFVCYNADTNP